MRIAQVAPLYESVPPKAYGGIERVVSNLTEELIRQGHNVTLYASGDSKTEAQLKSIAPTALRCIEDTADPLAFHFTMLEQVVRDSHTYDLVHFHVDYLHFPFSRRLNCPQVTTLHWRLDIPGLELFYAEYRDMPVVAISESQRRQLDWLNWQGTVYHGLPPGGFFTEEPSAGYLAFLGRLAPEKRPDLAIEIARQARLPIAIAAKIDNGDRRYFERTIEPLLAEPFVDYRGELNGTAIERFLSGARALLFPIDWPEPFGLVLIEALACGTPVIAFGRGSVPEIIEDGVTGFIVNTVEEAVDKVAQIEQISRKRCREAFESRFTASRMTESYLAIYDKLSGAESIQRNSEIYDGQRKCALSL